MHIPFFRRPAAVSRRSGRRPWHSQPVYLDCGAVTTRLQIDSRQLWQSASCVAVAGDGLQQRGAPAFFGDAAYALLGKTGKKVSLRFPMEAGAPQDSTIINSWLSHIQDIAARDSTLRDQWLSPAGWVGVPGDLSEVEIASWKAALAKTGWSRLRLLPSAQAVAAHMKWDMTNGSICLVQLGGSYSEITILVRGDVFASRRIHWGGIRLTEKIQEMLRLKHQISVSWPSAEQVKIQLGALGSAVPSEKKRVIRGKHVVTQLGATQIVTADEVKTILQTSLEPLIVAISNFFASVPVDIASDSLEDGLWIAGGVAQTPGIAAALSKRLHSPVSVVEAPALAVIQGLAAFDQLQARVDASV